MQRSHVQEGTLVVLAKAPMAGRSKTRCSPPCTPAQAARIAEAALADTLAAVAATPTRRRVLVLDGRPGPWLPDGFEVIAQRGAGLDERLAAAFDDVGGPMLLVGMDTPQVTPTLLGQALHELLAGPSDAVLGLASDGGYWTIGLLRPDPRVFVGVPMSEPDTGRHQRERLARLGLATAMLPELTDVDTFATALEVAKHCAGPGFPVTVAAISAELEPLPVALV